MLHCNMTLSNTLQLALEDLIADLRHARRTGDLGRLALVAYCDVRPWARKAGEVELAELLSEMMTESPHPTRRAFLDLIDRLIFEMLRIHQQACTDLPADARLPHPALQR